VLEFPGYGYRRVTAELHRQQWAVKHKRVLRIMRQEALLCHLQRNWIVTTDSCHGLQTYPNLLTSLVLHRPNQAWVADITYIRLASAFVYLACVLDTWSRRCVGWHLSRTINTQLMLAALNHAIVMHQPTAGLIHHLDRGVQYASAAYVERLRAIGAQVSMSAKGNPYDNAKAESFFKTLKYISSSTRRSATPRSRLADSSMMCIIRSACIRASAMCRQSSTKAFTTPSRSIPQ
jgi:putative transposase